MPLYEYCCPACNDKFEILRSMSDSDKEAKCPKCNSMSKRALSRFASFAKDSSGQSTPIAGTGSSCGCCSSSSCSTCGA